MSDHDQLPRCRCNAPTFGPSSGWRRHGPNEQRTRTAHSTGPARVNERARMRRLLLVTYLRQSGRFTLRTETTMPTPRLPPELLDHIADLLRDSEKELKNCCLVSKSWVPRTRRHLFVKIRFNTEITLRSWRETFPDPSTSPAYYTKTLAIECIPVGITAEDAEPGGWIGGFSGVVHLEVGDREHAKEVPIGSLLLFHGVSPAVKSLRVDFFIPFTLTGFRPHPFISSSRGPGRARSEFVDQRRLWS